jgi:hypothetical protein
LTNTKEKVWSLEVSLREVEAGGYELKRVMKEATEKHARRDREVEFEVALKSL